MKRDSVSTICFYGITFAALMAISGCGQSPETEGEAAAPPGPPPSFVRVAPIVDKKIQPEIRLVATMHPRRTSIVASGANGVVADFPLDAGSFVPKGTLLSQLKVKATDLKIAEEQARLREREQELKELEAGSRLKEVEASKAQMMAAQIAKRVTEQKLKRAEGLFKRNALNQDERDTAHEKAEAAKHLYAAAEAKFKLVEEGPRKEQIEQARSRVAAQKALIEYLLVEKEKRTTRAPFDGVIVKTHTFNGQWLSKGDPVITLARMDLIIAIANVDQAMLKYITLGEMVDVRVPGTKPEIWKGQIGAVISKSKWESGSRSFPVRILLHNKFKDSLRGKIPVLKEGMHAEVLFKGPEVDSILVPKDALVRTSRGKSIFVYKPTTETGESGVVEQVPVETDIGEGEMIRLMGDGLNLKQGQVVVEGAERLRPFQNVQILQESMGEPTPNEAISPLENEKQPSGEENQAPEQNLKNAAGSEGLHKKTEQKQPGKSQAS